MSSDAGPQQLVRAAGGVVWRGDTSSPPAPLEVLLVHRPKYDDWTFPKGKLSAGEGDVEGALREVEEETGLRCRLGPELISVSYNDNMGRPKVVRYWAMSPEGGSFQPSNEVDRVRWVTADDAHATLTYDRDRAILRSLLEVRDTPAGLDGLVQ